MSKLTVLDKIKNPDVPGLEDPLPPVPPPPIISYNNPAPVPEKAPASTPNVVKPTNLVAYPIPKQAYFPSMVTPPLPPQHDQSWWVPNETDSEVYNQWYESAYKAALRASSDKDGSGKPKVKYVKRKLEVVDPQADAERVANAQKELSALMKPLKCDLCNAVMNSTSQSAIHYSGKPHQKKVSMYLNQSAKKIKIDDGQVSSTTNDSYSHCEICKIWFTSMTDATQHYAGKKHLKAVYGHTKTKPKKPTSNKNPIDPTGRYGIGMAFAPPQPEAVPIPQLPLPPEIPPAAVPPIPQYKPALVAYPIPFRCEICDISVNRQDQLETHKRGAKHLKMLKHHGLSLPQPDPVFLVPPPIDYSIYRTPSGQYYCAPCNLSLNSESSFAQHVDSKKHKSQITPKQQPSSGSATKKKQKGIQRKVNE
ncbi:zinc finger protein 346-like [Copidosoma floridanum]|uniref:zinc finger protein 346-like n=1 Tax=Copidosoma floridanum TaxID=29053 RepID=UPI0006C9A125|nr:zinc finger protein 346-like [Copidosoma floridanum]